MNTVSVEIKDEFIDEEVLLKEMTDTIVSLLLEAQEQRPESFAEEAPVIKLMADENSCLAFGYDTPLSRDFLNRLEQDVQKQINAWFTPTILH